MLGLLSVVNGLAALLIWKWQEENGASRNPKAALRFLYTRYDRFMSFIDIFTDNRVIYKAPIHNVSDVWLLYATNLNAHLVACNAVQFSPNVFDLVKIIPMQYVWIHIQIIPIYITSVILVISFS